MSSSPASPFAGSNVGPGLIITPDSVALGQATILATIDNRTLEIQPIDCFAFAQDSPEANRWTEFERALLETKLGTAQSIFIVIPEPPGPKGLSEWLRDLPVLTPKPGHIVIDSTETVSTLLVGVNKRTTEPNYVSSFQYDPIQDQLMRAGVIPEAEPIDTATFTPVWTRPKELQDSDRLQLRLDKPIRHDGSADRWWVRTRGGDEILVALADCYTGPVARNPEAYNLAWQLMEAYGGSLILSLPRVAACHDWIASLRPGTEHAGEIWLNDKQTLNQRLVKARLATVTQEETE